MHGISSTPSLFLSFYYYYFLLPSPSRVVLSSAQMVRGMEAVAGEGKYKVAGVTVSSKKNKKTVKPAPLRQATIDLPKKHILMIFFYFNLLLPFFKKKKKGEIFKQRASRINRALYHIGEPKYKAHTPAAPQ